VDSSPLRAALKSYVSLDCNIKGRAGQSEYVLQELILLSALPETSRVGLGKLCCLSV